MKPTILGTRPTGMGGQAIAVFHQFHFGFGAKPKFYILPHPELPKMAVLNSALLSLRSSDARGAVNRKPQGCAVGEFFRLKN